MVVQLEEEERRGKGRPHPFQAALTAAPTHPGMYAFIF